MYLQNFQDSDLLSSSIKMMDNSWDLFQEILICIIMQCDFNDL